MVLLGNSSQKRPRRAVALLSNDLHFFPRVKIPWNLFPRGFLQGTNFASHLFSKGEGFPSGALPRGANSKGTDLQCTPYSKGTFSKAQFPRPNFQGPISKVQFPKPNFQGPISKAQFLSPISNLPANQAKRDYLWEQDISTAWESLKQTNSNNYTLK